MADQSDCGSDQIYDAFAEHYRSYSGTKATYIKAVDDKVAQLAPDAFDLMLDYGAGDGVRGAKLFERLKGKALVQADISTEMVARCKQLGVADVVWDIKDGNWSDQVVEADVAVCLWNVMGHIPTTSDRINTLKGIFNLMRPGACLFLDVNNRHYQGYGALRSIWRRVLDRIWPDYSRGDVQFNWTIDGVEYPAKGHFFTRKEMEYLLTSAGFQIREFCTFDYGDGQESTSSSKGQMFFMAVKPAK